MASRTVNSVRNPVWADVGQTRINLEVDFDELDEVFVDFCADPNDPEPWGVDLYNRAVSGEFGAISDFVPMGPITGDEAMALLRSQRNRLLEDTDYIEMPTRWATLSEADQAAWTAYRNALRDLPQNYPNAELHADESAKHTVWVNCEWPVKPE